MVTQRTQGLYRVFLLCQIVLVAVLFWFGVWVMVTFYSPGAELTWRRYSIYCGLLVLGMTIESLSRDGSKNYFLQNELLRQHRLSLRQVFASIGTLVLYLIATKDAFMLAQQLVLEEIIFRPVPAQRLDRHAQDQQSAVNAIALPGQFPSRRIKGDHDPDAEPEKDGHEQDLAEQENAI